MDKEYFKKYYQTNKEKIKNYRKERYKNDEAYRESVKASIKKYNSKKKGAKNAKRKIKIIGTSDSICEDGGNSEHGELRVNQI